jgi:hypothetical protein
VTSLNLEQYNEKKNQVQRVVETIVFLKDPNYTGVQERELEVAIRITGCGHDKVLNLNHVYWWYRHYEARIQKCKVHGVESQVMLGTQRAHYVQC